MLTNLLISTFYVNAGDPQRPNDHPLNPSGFDDNIGKYKNYIANWYNTFIAVTENVETTDIVLLHDGLPLDVISHFQGIKFLDYSSYTTNRESVNDIRYFHYQQYLEESLVQYQMILTTDLHDVHFGLDPFVYLRQQLSTQPIALSLGHEPPRSRKNWKKFVTERDLRPCMDHDQSLLNGTLEWIEANPQWQTSPGIIGGEGRTVSLLFDEMARQLEEAPKDLDCNMGILQSSLFNLCEQQQRCVILNDEVFYSDYKAYESPKTGVRHGVYHK